MDRATFADRIRSVVHKCSESYVVRGSFAHDDFHLDSDSGVSLSDLDLIYRCTEDERHRRARDVETALQESHGIELRVSVQPDDHHSPLSPEDASYLVLGEYLRHYYEWRNDPWKMSYLLAKTTLGILRSTPSERYLTVATAINTRDARVAAAVKTGSARDFGRDNARRLLKVGMGRNSEAWRLLSVLDLEPSPDTYLEYVADLEKRESVHPWMRALMTRLLINAMPTVTHS